MSQPPIIDRKRKRSSAPPSRSPRLLPSDAINPLSHPPATLRQFAVAGLPETEDLPSVVYPGFPHRPLPTRQGAVPGDGDGDGDGGTGTSSWADIKAEAEAEAGTGTATETDAETEPETTGQATADQDADEAAAARHRAEKRATGLARESRLHEREVGVVAAILRRSLAEGKISRAKAAFARLARSRVHGKEVDLRYGGYWALGAEVLMREGEEEDGDVAGGGGEGWAGGEGEDGSKKRRRWGSARNMVRVKAYFEDLIQLHPYDRHHPGSISALDFWPVMLSCEMYNVYIEHKLALEQLEAGGEDEDFVGGGDVDMDGGAEERYDYDEEQVDGSGGLLQGRGTQWEEARREAKNKLRLQALEGMRDIASRMDKVMENQPYSTSLEMLRLRGMAALYMGDLAVPPHPRTAEEDREGQARKQKEADRARTVFRKLLERGGELEPWFLHLMQLDDIVKGEVEEEDEENGGAELLPMYSSLPVRQP